MNKFWRARCAVPYPKPAEIAAVERYLLDCGEQFSRVGGLFYFHAPHTRARALLLEHGAPISFEFF